MVTLELTKFLTRSNVEVQMYLFDRLDFLLTIEGVHAHLASVVLEVSNTNLNYFKIMHIVL